MEKSETIGELAKALCVVQGNLEGAKKDSTNPFFRSKYADLSSVWEACRKLLAENGLAVVQTNTPSSETAIIDTTLLHSSGEWISGSLEVTLTKNDPQGFGSAMTYARRYGLSAMVGICPEDDDAESATKREAPTEKPKKAEKPKEETVNLVWFRDKLKALAEKDELWKPELMVEYLREEYRIGGESTADCLRAMGDTEKALFAMTVKGGLKKNGLS